MSARETIAWALTVINDGKKTPDVMAAQIIDYLNHSGYRILAPGQRDPETLEAAAKAIESLTVPGYHPDDLYKFRDVTGLAAAAIRALGGGEG